MTSDKAKPGTASDIKASREYWNFGVNDPTGLLAQRNIMQLAEWDDRLNPAARKVIGFFLDWHHGDYGDSLASIRHITAHLNARAPEGHAISKRTVEEGISRARDSGWLVRTLKGTSRKNASRYVFAPDILANATLGRLPTVRDTTDGSDTSTVRNVPDSTVRNAPDGFGPTVRDVPDKDTYTRHAYKEACTCSVIDLPQASPAAEGGELAGGFDLLASAYAKPGDNQPQARLAFLQINPDEAELSRMVKAAASWKATAKGPRMSLERWLKEKRWLTTEEFKHDNRPTSRYPSCVVTWVKARKDGGALVKYRDPQGSAQTMQLDADELATLLDYSAYDRPACKNPSEDLHELIGAHFCIDEEDGSFCGYR
jgi:hypothetical protein